jgi:hypothetical protein
VQVLFTQWGWTALAFLPAVEFVLLLVHLLVALGTKWLLVGRCKEGSYPIYGRFYIMHWLANLLSMVSGFCNCTAGMLYVAHFCEQ